MGDGVKMRTRNIKPGFFKNEYLSECDPLARILFEGLWCLADREGRLEDRPKRIKNEILPYDDCNVDELLNQLANNKEKFIIRYEIHGDKYIQITNFMKHNNPHKNEMPSEIPAFSEQKNREKTRTTRKSSRSTRECNDSNPALYPIPYTLNLIPNIDSNNPILPSDEVELSDLEKTVLEFIDERKSMKKPMTDRAIKMMRNDLDKHASSDEEKIAMLRKSIINGWQGVFPLTQNEKKELNKGGYEDI